MRLAVLVIGISLLAGGCSRVPQCGDSDATSLVKQIVAGQIADGDLVKPEKIAPMLDMRNIQTLQKKQDPTSYVCKGEVYFTTPEKVSDVYANLDAIAQRADGTPHALQVIAAATALTQGMMSESGNPLALATATNQQREQLARQLVSAGIPVSFTVNGIEKGKDGANFQVELRTERDLTPVSALLFLSALDEQMQSAQRESVKLPQPAQAANDSQQESPQLPQTAEPANAPVSQQESPQPASASAAASGSQPAGIEVARGPGPTATAGNSTSVSTAPATPAEVADNTPFAPSFDCQKASTGAERLVCSDRDLARLDVAVAQAYTHARDKAADKRQLRADQLEWMKTRRNACSDKACMQEAYSQRLSQLRGDAVAGERGKEK